MTYTTPAIESVLDLDGRLGEWSFSKRVGDDEWID